MHTIQKLINDFNSIIILRHGRPDLDAYGSQFGLYYALKERYSNKAIYAVGDTNSLNYFQPLDEVSPEVYPESLVIILDTGSEQMMENLYYKQANKLIIIDHHQNQPDIRYDCYLRNTEASSTAEMVTKWLLDHHYSIPPLSARALYAGIVSDTGRFMYKGVSSQTFYMAAKLLETGVDIQELYNKMYSEPLKMKQLKAVFFSTIQLTKNKVAYRKNDLDFLRTYQVDTNTVSRGMVNQMAGIEEVLIWANFTYDESTQSIVCELRSRDIPILSIAQKHGGGGHLNACGCTVATWEETDVLLNELDQIMEDYHG